MVTPHIPWKFRANRSSRFLVILLTKKQRKKEWCIQTNKEINRKQYPSRGRGNNISAFLSCCFTPGFCVLCRSASSTASVSAASAHALSAPGRVTTRSVAGTTCRPRSPAFQTSPAADVCSRAADEEVPLRVRPAALSTSSRTELHRLLVRCRLAGSFQATGRRRPGDCRPCATWCRSSHRCKTLLQGEFTAHRTVAYYLCLTSDLTMWPVLPHRRANHPVGPRAWRISP